MVDKASFSEQTECFWDPSDLVGCLCLFRPLPVHAVWLTSTTSGSVQVERAGVLQSLTRLMVGKYEFSLKTPLCCLLFATASISVLEETVLQKPACSARTSHREIFILSIELYTASRTAESKRSSRASWLHACLLTGGILQTAKHSAGSLFPPRQRWDTETGAPEPSCRWSCKKLGRS